MESAFANPEYVPADNPKTNFPWGPVAGLVAFGAIAAVILYKWNDIAAAINPSKPYVPPAGTPGQLVIQSGQRPTYLVPFPTTLQPQFQPINEQTFGQQ